MATGYAFPDTGLLVDVGGGDGTLLAAILATRPQLRGVLLEQPHVVPQAQATLAAKGVSERVEVVGGDFFTTVPSEGDCYVLSAVLHDWGDEAAIAILKQCRLAMPPEAKLVVVEQVLSPGADQSAVKLADVHMLLTNAGGKERTEAEWRELLQTAGFELQARTRLNSTFEVLQARIS